MERSFLSPVQKFIKAESFSGVLLFVVTVLALIISNLPTYEAYETLLQYKIGIQSENFTLVKPLILWINDGLMAIFFFLIGLEIKREILIGELNSIKKASFPVFAAIGGMVVPIVFYFLLNQNPETNNGWGISMATDIAFTLAILQLLGNKVPLGLKIFLTAFAIIDDIGAVLAIAIFYTGNVSWVYLLYSGIILLVLYTLSYFRIYHRFLLLILGIPVWYFFLKSGIHPTVAGILLAFSIPVSQKIDEYQYADKLNKIIDKLVRSTNTNKLPVLTEKQIEEIDNLEEWTDRVQSPVQQLEHRLHNWVAYLIMPVFAFANAGVRFSAEADISLPLILTVAISLVLGKTIGVSFFSYLSLKMKITSLPENTNLTQVFGIAILSGVGFTMSLFIGSLAFSGQPVYLDSAKIGILGGSLIAGITGYLVIKKGINKLPDITK